MNSEHPVWREPSPQVDGAAIPLPRHCSCRLGRLPGTAVVSRLPSGQVEVPLWSALLLGSEESHSYDLVHFAFQMGKLRLRKVDIAPREAWRQSLDKGPAPGSVPAGSTDPVPDALLRVCRNLSLLESPVPISNSVSELRLWFWPQREVSCFLFPVWAVSQLMRK